MKFYSIMFMIAGIIFFILSGIMHEQAHVQIYKTYGIDSEVHYFSHFPTMVTISNGTCPTAECNLAHDLNEIVGYNLDGLFMLIFLGLFFIIIILEKKND